MSPRISRRDALRGGGAILLGSIAGCTSFDSPAPDGVRIVRAYITNTIDSDLDVDVHLLDGEETAYWKTVTASADPPGLEAGGVTLHDIPETPGEYFAAARLVDVPAAEPDTFDIAQTAREHESECARIRLLIKERDADEPPEISFQVSPAAEFWSCDPNAR